jgi:NAD(P)H-hydrate epimerase
MLNMIRGDDLAGLKTEGGLVYLTAQEMADADKVAIEHYGIDVLSLMENAGLGAAKLAQRMLAGDVAGKKVCCLVGKGNNGGDGLVAARNLHDWGSEVSVVLGGERAEFRDVPAKQLEIVEKLGIGTDGPEGDFRGAELLVDALLGYGSRGNPREPLAGLIRRANASKIPILAVDIPSGLDSTTGEPGNPCIMARATVTFGLPKTGFLNPRAREFVGDLYLADISMPREIYERYSQHLIFAKDTLVELW